MVHNLNLWRMVEIGVREIFLGIDALMLTGNQTTDCYFTAGVNTRVKPRCGNPSEFRNRAFYAK